MLTTSGVSGLINKLPEAHVQLPRFRIRLGAFSARRPGDARLLPACQERLFAAARALWPTASTRCGCAPPTPPATSTRLRRRGRLRRIPFLVTLRRWTTSRRVAGRHRTPGRSPAHASESAGRRFRARFDQGRRLTRPARAARCGPPPPLPTAPTRFGFAPPTAPATSTRRRRPGRSRSSPSAGSPDFPAHWARTKPACTRRRVERLPP